MLAQQLQSRLLHHRQPSAPSASACPVVVRQPVNQRCPVARPAAPVPQGPPRHQLTVCAARRGRPPAEPTEEPAADGPDEEYLEENEIGYDEEEEEDSEFVQQLDPMSRRLMGFKEPGVVDEEEYDEEEEAEGEDSLDEAAEADRDGLASDEDVGEPSTSYPEPPDRSFRAADLFGEAALFDIALWLSTEYPALVVVGVQSNPHLVVPGDVFVMHDDLTPDDEEMAVAVALQQGAVVVVVQQLRAEDNPGMGRGYEPLEGLVPEHVPLIRVEDTIKVGSRLGAAFYDVPSRNMVTIGVLGLLGKTTTAWLIRGILEELGQTVGLISSIEHAIAEDRLDEDGFLWEPLEEDPSAERESSVPFKLIPYAGKYEQYYSSRMPGLNAQKLLAGMRDRGAGIAVMELEAEALALGTYDYVDMNVAVVTNLSPRQGLSPASHAEQVEAVADSVDLVVELLRDRLTDPDTQALVINADDPLTPELLAELGGVVPVVTYGVANAGADVWAENVKSNIFENEVIVRTPIGRLQIITNLLGTHNVSNLVAAVATGIALKAPLTSIVAGIEAVEIPGRSEVLDEGQDFSVVVDAACNPDQLGAMLDALRAGGARQIFTVFGCSGNDDPSIRPKMGAVAHAKSDYVILTNENPRLEDPAKVVADVVAGWPDDMINRYSAYAYPPFQDQGRAPLWFEPYLQKAQRENRRYVMEDRYSAIRAAIGTAGPQDVVLLAGKGHDDWVEHADEDGTVLKGWLDDRVEARNALSKLKYLKQVSKSRETLPWGSKIETLMETLTVSSSAATTMATIEEMNAAQENAGTEDADE